MVGYLLYIGVLVPFYNLKSFFLKLLKNLSKLSKFSKIMAFAAPKPVILMYQFSKIMAFPAPELAILAKFSA